MLLLPTLAWATWAAAAAASTGTGTGTGESAAFTPRHLASLQNRTQALFRHGWDSYVEAGWPADEVRPLTCRPYGPQHTAADDPHNDVLGNVTSTALDNLDTLVMLGEWRRLAAALRHLRARRALFRQDRTVQVFEASIRWLGGLLSAHLALVDVDWAHSADMRALAAAYDGFLLRMAYDLGLRLAPAYNTATGLPVPRINLRRGLAAVPPAANNGACTAGAATPFVELAVLSRLTGDARLEALSRTTFDKLWAARSEMGLVPMSLDPLRAVWTEPVTGIGASIDSFYEYALKGAVVLGDDALWAVFARSYAALSAHSALRKGLDGWAVFTNVHTGTIGRYTMWIDSLSAFWPGLQVLAGRLSDAVSSHLVFLKIWDHFDAIPERWNTDTGPVVEPAHQLENAVDLEWYPLRPEFIESTYYLYRATRDPVYLQAGVRVLRLFETEFWAPCGFAGFQDIRTGEKQDRMETFVLGESLKYLYLLFDEANESYVHRPDMKAKNWVFSTEAHPLWLSKKLQKKSVAWFKPHLSKDPIPKHPPPSKGVLEHMWRGMSQSQVSEIAPLSPEPEVPTVNRLGPESRFLHDDWLQCEAAPRQFRGAKDANFVTSGYLHWQHMYLPDLSMASTLTRPPHLTNNNDSIIERSEQFLATYGLGANLQCARPPTAEEKELVVGKQKRPENYEMYRVLQQTAEYPFAPGDVVMPMVQGRFRFEHLAAGAVDGNNTEITMSYLRDAQIGTGKKFTAEVLRFVSVNGHWLQPGQTVWTERGCFEGAQETFELSTNSGVYMNGLYVENLKVY